MIFPKETRGAIWLANGKPVEIAWPDGRHEPNPGHSYTLQSRTSEAGDYSVLVLSAKRGEDGWLAKVRLDGDIRNPLRLKAKRPPARKESSAVDPMPDVTETEPDQPPSDYVRRLAEEAQLRNVMRQAQHKEMQAKMRAEEKLLKARRKGEPTKLAEGRLDRATRRCEEARDALADAA